MEFFSACLIYLFAIFAVAAADDTAEADILACCTSIGTQLPGQVIYPQTAGVYDNANDNRWSATSMLKPSCIVQATSAQDVSATIKILTKGANGDNFTCKFAIKSGGHTPYAGANDIDGGISLDLSWINQTTLSSNRSYVSLGTGSTWLNAYEKLDGTGTAFPGGRCGDSGVGGLTLGGGISFFAPRVGFVADNVINYEVVLASGEIINANRTSNDDLFVALKGGSSNFGVVTRFDITAFENSELWGGGIVNPATANTTAQVLSAMYTFTNNNHKDPYASYGPIFSYSNGTKQIINSLVYTKATAHPEIFSQLESITPQLTNTLRFTGLADLTSEGSSFMPRGYRDLMATVTFQNNIQALGIVQNITNDIYATVDTIPDMDWIFSYEPLPQLFTTQGAEQGNGGNMLGLNRTNDDLILMMLAPRWKDAQYDAAMNNAAVQWVNEVMETTNLLGFENSFFYLNYADSFQDPLGSYGPESVNFMKGVAAKYDPEGVFQTLVPGGFKVSQAQAG